MATLSSNPSSVVSAGTWTGGANTYASDNVFATNTGSVQNTEYPMEVGGFNLSGIPAGNTIDSVTVTIEAKTGTNNRAQIKGELYDGATLLGTLALTNLTNADVAYTFSGTATLAQLQSANLKVRVTNKRIVSQASTTSVDWVKIDVDYSPPGPPPGTGSLAVTTSRSAAATVFTPPPALRTNLFPNPSLEVDTTSWFAGIGTLARTTTQARDGVASLSVTATTTFIQTYIASGTGVNSTPVIAGREYFVSVYSRAATTTRIIALTVQFYTAAGSLIGGVSTVDSRANTTTGWTRYSGYVLAPPTAAFVTVGLPISPTVAGEVHYFDSALLQDMAATPGGDLVVNGTFETNTTGWIVASGATLAQTSAQAQAGSGSMEVTSTSTSNWVIGTPTGTSGMPVTPGMPVVASAYVRAATFGRSMQLGVVWYTAAGSTIGSASGSSVTDTTTGWTQITCVTTAPTNAAYARIQVTCVAFVAADVQYIDSVTLVSYPAVTAPTYFDGDTAAGAGVEYAWYGTPHASTSFEYTASGGPITATASLAVTTTATATAVPDKRVGTITLAVTTSASAAASVSTGPVSHTATAALAVTATLSAAATATPPSSGFVPSDLTGLATWYDADDASTFSFSSGTVVSQWRDKSGSARHLAQATTSLQPSRSGTQAGRPTVAFDGSDDYLDSTSFTLAQPMTVFLALDASAATTQGWFSSVGNNFQIYVGGGSLFIYAGTTPSGLSLTSAYSGPHTWSFYANGASTQGYKDGTLLATGDTGSNGTTTGWRTAERNLTSGYRLQGELFEIVVYDRVLTTTERQQVEAYLDAKWINPPAGTTWTTTAALSVTTTASAAASRATSATTSSLALTATLSASATRTAAPATASLAVVTTASAAATRTTSSTTAALAVTTSRSAAATRSTSSTTNVLAVTTSRTASATRTAAPAAGTLLVVTTATSSATRSTSSATTPLAITTTLSAAATKSSAGSVSGSLAVTTTILASASRATASTSTALAVTTTATSTASRATSSSTALLAVTTTATAAATKPSAGSVGGSLAVTTSITSSASRTTSATAALAITTSRSASATRTTTATTASLSVVTSRTAAAGRATSSTTTPLVVVTTASASATKSSAGTTGGSLSVTTTVTASTTRSTSVTTSSLNVTTSRTATVAKGTSTTTTSLSVTTSRTATAGVTKATTTVGLSVVTTRTASATRTTRVTGSLAVVATFTATAGVSIGDLKIGWVVVDGVKRPVVGAWVIIGEQKREVVRARMVVDETLHPIV